VTGSVYVRQGATLTAPPLTKTGSVYVQEGATLTAPLIGYPKTNQDA
jgi:heme oxygenase